jgi:hypothetical protein
MYLHSLSPFERSGSKRLALTDQASLSDRQIDFAYNAQPTAVHRFLLQSVHGKRFTSFELSMDEARRQASVGRWTKRSVERVFYLLQNPIP